MAELVPFTFTGTPVRTLLLDGEPWFVAVDVCKVLDIGNSRMVVSRLDEDGVSTTDVIDSMGRTQTAAIVSDSGLYELIFQSRKPEAKAFRRWVTHEVIPAIRKTGSYSVGKPMTELEMAERYVLALHRNQELEPKAEAFDSFMTADGDYTVATVAQMLGLGQNRLFARLRDEGVLLVSGKRKNTPYQRYAHHFRVVVDTWSDGDREHATYRTYVRPSGVDFIRKKLNLVGGQAELFIVNGGAA